MRIFNLLLISIALLISFTGCIKDEDVPPEPVCTPGDTRDADDMCNSGTCADDGVWNCTFDECLPTTCAVDECGPRPNVPNQVCADGSTCLLYTSDAADD